MPIKKLLKDILRDEFGFNGVVVSDYYGIGNLVDIDKITPSKEEAGYLAFKAGVDIELPDYFGFQHLKSYVEEGKN